MVKEGYFPTEKKRFEIRGDVSKERVENLKIFYLVLQEKLPQVTIGFGMYGSLTKGKVLREDSWLGLRKREYE